MKPFKGKRTRNHCHRRESKSSGHSWQHRVERGRSRPFMATHSHEAYRACHSWRAHGRKASGASHSWRAHKWISAWVKHNKSLSLLGRSKVKEEGQARSPQ
jgi:hypothetical protein